MVTGYGCLHSSLVSSLSLGNVDSDALQATSQHRLICNFMLRCIFVVFSHSGRAL